MNSFKKVSLIIAAALTSTMIVATSSNAAAMTVTVGGAANTTTSAAPSTVAVPSTNVIDAGHSVAIAATADSGTTVSFSSSSTVKIVTALNTTDAPKTATSGTDAYSVASTGAAVTIYAYTTSTTTGSVTIKNGAYSTIVYVKGTAGPVAKISTSVPSAAAINTAPSISVSATDVFGNPVGGEEISVTIVGAKFGADNSITKLLTTSSVTSAAGITPVTVLGSVSASLAAVSSGTVTVVATDVSIADTAVGLPSAVKTAIGTFIVADLEGQIAGLKAELAAAVAARAADKTASDAKYAALLKAYNVKAKKYGFAKKK
jgi:hypothetical protein